MAGSRWIGGSRTFVRLQCCSVVFYACGFPLVFALKAGWVQVELCRKMAIAFLLVADGAFSVHHGKICAPGFLPLEDMGRVVVRVKCLVHSLQGSNLGF